MKETEYSRGNRNLSFADRAIQTDKHEFYGAKARVQPVHLTVVDTLFLAKRAEPGLGRHHLKA